MEPCAYEYGVEVPTPLNRKLHEVSWEVQRGPVKIESSRQDSSMPTCGADGQDPRQVDSRSVRRRHGEPALHCINAVCQFRLCDDRQCQPLCMCDWIEYDIQSLFCS